MDINIETTTDSRMAILLQAVSELAGTLALELGTNPEQVISDNLFLATKRVMQSGEEAVSDKVLGNFPMLQELLD